MRSAKGQKARRRARFAAAVWSVLTAAALTAPGGGMSTPGWLPELIAAAADKLVHGALFAVHAALVAAALTPPGGRRLAAAGAISLAFAGALELVQIPLPTRSWEVADLAAGGAGILAALGVRAVVDRS